MNRYHVALIPGDGIGVDVTRESQKALDTLADVHGGFQMEYREFPWSCAYYLKYGSMMPEDGLEQLKPFDAIYLGAVGYPGVPDHVSLWGLLLPIRRTFKQYINLRPVKLLRGLTSPLRDRDQDDIDFLVVRENNEGEYSNMGGRIYEGTAQEIAIQNAVFTRFGIERVLQYAFDLAAKSKRKRLTAATKSNGITYTMPFWDDMVQSFAAKYPDVSTSITHIDALTAFFVSQTQTFDVVVASNLFGDILTDLGAAIAGGMGVAPSANLNPEKEFPSMFEPVHGSAPDIAGKGIANPIAALWTASMMLEHLGERESAALLLDSIQDVLEAEEVLTPDLGGRATTTEVGDAVCARIRARSQL